MKSNPDILVVFYTRHGNTAKMAEAIAEGAGEKGANVKLMRLADDVPIDIVKKDENWHQKHLKLEEQ